MNRILTVTHLSLLLAGAALPLSACAVPAGERDETIEAAGPEPVGESEDALTTLIADKQISGQSSQDGPALTMYDPAYEVVMVHRGQSSNNLYMSTFDGYAWTTNQQIPGQSSKAAVALTQHSDGKMHMVHQCGTSNYLCHYTNASTSPNQWTPIATLSFESSATPALVSEPTHHAVMMVWSPGGGVGSKLDYAFYDGSTQTWGPASVFQDLTGFASQAPALAVFNGHVHMAYAVSSGEIRFAEYTGSGWENRLSDVNSRWTRGAPSLTSYAGRLYLIHRGYNDNNIWWASATDGVHFTSEQAYATSGTTQGTPALVTYGLQMVLSHIGSSSSNLFFSTYQP